MNEVLKIRTEKDIYPSESVLLMEIGETECNFAIMHHAGRIIYEFAYYRSDGDEELLQKIFDRYELLHSAFYRTAVSWYMPQCILIPNRFYDHQQSKILLDELFGRDSNVAITESVAQWQINTAYQVPVADHQSISRQYTTGNFWHHYSVQLKNSTNGDGSSMTVDFKSDSFSVVVTRDNSLLLAQIFNYTSAGDVLYYLLKICREFAISQADVNVVLSGLVDKQSSVFNELKQYFIHIEFASLQNNVRLGEAFGDHPQHYFTSLSRLAACVS